MQHPMGDTLQAPRLTLNVSSDLGPEYPRIQVSANQTELGQTTRVLVILFYCNLSVSGA